MQGQENSAGKGTRFGKSGRQIQPLSRKKGVKLETLNSLEDHGDALADADAHGGQAESCIAIVHRVDKCRGDAGAEAPSG